MVKLSGWQRLWVVLSVMWLIPAMVVGLARWPAHDLKTLSELEDPRCRALLEEPQPSILDQLVAKVDVILARQACPSLALTLDRHPTWTIHSRQD